MMRQFTEDDLRRAERRVREAERHLARQHVAINRFETLGDTEQANLVREYLVMCEKRVELAREGLRRLERQRGLAPRIRK
jgi:hypothetical protein